MSRALFVYWHVSGDIAAAEAAVRQMQAGLVVDNPALIARLYRKVGDGRCTLMETYAYADTAPGRDLNPAVQRQIEETAATALLPWCGDGRHVEVFEACG